MPLNNFRRTFASGIMGVFIAGLAACGDATAPPKPDAIEVVAGDAQADTIGASLSTPLRIRVLDERGRPLRGEVVSWQVAAGDAVVTPVAPATDSAGIAEASVRLGSAAGDVRVVASVGTQHTVTFTATNAAGRPTTATASLATLRFSSLGDTLRVALLAKDRAGNEVDTARATWTSSAPEVVAIPKAGVTVSLAPGSATVTAVIDNGPTVVLPVTVTQEIAAINIVPGPRTFTAIGDNLQLTARALDRNQFEIPGVQLQWSSTDTSIVKVDATGLVSSVGAGSADVSVHSAAATAVTAFSVVQDAATVTISQDSFTLAAFADTTRATATARDRNGHVIVAASFAWSVTDTAIAKVDASGLLTARGNGSSVLQASYDGITGDAAVVVRQRAARVSVASDVQQLHSVEDTAHFAATAYDANDFAIASAVFDWSSSDSSVATVDDAGVVISRGPGEAEISASLDAATGSAEIVIKQIPASVTVLPAELTLSALEDTAYLSAVAYDSMGHEISDAPFTWTSEISAIASVNSAGMVTGHEPGTTRIMATTGDVQGAMTLTVRQAAARVALVSDVATLSAVADTAHLLAIAYDLNDNVIEDAAFTWSVADASIATIDAYGIVTSRRGGETAFTVRSGQVTATGRIRVVQRAVELSLAAPTDSLRGPDHRIQLVATARDRNGYEVTARSFNWRSLRTAAVRVSESGILSAGGTRGDARIIASLDGEADTVTVTHMPYGVLVLTFDDAFVDVYTRVLPLLQQHGIRANIALPTGWVGRSGHLTLSQIREIHAAGWSIVPHSVNHEDLTGMPRPRMQQEISESRQWVEDQGFRGSTVFVVPFHRWGDREKSEITLQFEAARGYGTTHPSHGGMVDWPATDPYALTSIPADEFFETESGREEMEALWVQAITNGKFVGTYFHDISAANYDNFVKTIERLAKYKNRLHTYSDLFE